MVGTAHHDSSGPKAPNGVGASGRSPRVHGYRAFETGNDPCPSRRRAADRERARAADHEQLMARLGATRAPRRAAADSAAADSATVASALDDVSDADLLASKRGNDAY